MSGPSESLTPPVEPRALGAGISLVLLVGLIYLLTLSPTVNSFDSGELIAGAYSLGIIHAPGYPLYLLTAHLFIQAPWGNPAFKVNLLSAVSAMLSVGLLFLASWRLTKALRVSILSTLIFGLSRMLWSDAVVAKVYALNALIVGAVVLAAIIWNERPTLRHLLALSILYGLSLAHHLSTTLLAPGLVALVILRGRRATFRTRDWAVALAGLCIPLLIYLYLPIRFHANPSLNYVGQYFDQRLDTLPGIVWMVTGRMFGQEMFGRSIADGMVELGVLSSKLWLNLLGGGTIIGSYGLLVLWRQRMGPLALFFLSGVLMVLFFFAFYDVVNNAEMILPAIVLSISPLAVGFWQIGRDLGILVPMSSHRNQMLGWTVVIGVGLLLIGVNWRYADRHNDWYADSFARRVMLDAEPRAIILAQWTSATPLEYLQIVEGSRPDVTIVDRGLVTLGVRDRLERIGQTADESLTEATMRELTRIIDEGLVNNRAVYIMEDDPLINRVYCLVPLSEGTYRILPRVGNGTHCVE